MKPVLSRFFAVFFFFASGAAAAAEVGRVLLAVGDVVAVREGKPVRLAFGTVVQDTDTLRTGPASNLQVRFTDESMLSLRENSEIRIDEYRFTGKEDGTERAFFRLLKGGLRAISGLIGRTNHANYRMGSVVATIGIRGTDFAATLCQQDCVTSNPGHLAKDGLYGRVIGASHGTNRIHVGNERDERTFGISENFYVADGKSIIEQLLVPPDFVSSRLESRKQGGTKGAAGGTGVEQAVAGGVQQESRVSTPPPPPPPPQFVATESRAASGTPTVVADTPTIGAVAAFVNAQGKASDGGAYVTPSMLTFDASGFVTGFNIPAGTTEVDGSGISPPGVSGTATSLTDTGSADPGDGSVDARWGRWSSTLTDDTGTSTLPGGLHGMIGKLTPPDVIAAKTGMVPFFPIAGTTPTNSLGESATSHFYPPVNVNFTTRVADVAPFTWSFPSNFWTFPSGSANVIITPGKGAGIEGLYTGGYCSGSNCYGPITLGVTGIFYGPAGDHLGAAFAGQSGSAKAMGVKLYSSVAE